MSTRSDCRKFAPNIFNKSKCTNCFRQKEEHSAEALESNRASRKISKCGYLFVAPGWDFSNPLNRTKRWQRRWFVLYDDGELTYSLDEHPDTVPQACVDMTLVLEVRDADEVTGHPFSLAIASPDRVTFIKGTCREETRWWSDVLSVYPRNKGRHKRNATFPGGQPTSLIQNGTTIRNGAGNISRPRHNSCHAGAWVTPPRPNLDSLSSELPTAPTPPLPTPETKVYNDQPVSSASPPTRDKINSEDKARSRRGTARGRSRATWSLPDTGDVQDGVDSAHHRILIEEYESESKREEKLKDIALSLTRPRERAVPSPPGPDPPTREVTVSPDVMSPTLESPGDSVDGIPDKYVRGDPDGCVRGAAARVELPAEGLLNMRKGWLLRQAGSGQAARHWFVLRGAALLYYRDPSAEDCGIMDGVIDLNGVNSVTETAPTRTYGFVIKTWDNRQYILSALTAVNRTNWVSAIRRTAGLPDNPMECPEKLYPEKPLLNLERQESMDTTDSLVSTPITPITPRSIMLSSDEEYRTASEGGRRDSVDWGDSVSNLPPSPVPCRNPISRVKDKVRSRNCQYSPSSIPSSPQSDETPPSDIDETDSHQNRSMREIIDPYQHIVKEKKIHDESLKPLKAPYSTTIDKQAIEIEDLRKQLKIAVNDVNCAEKELKRLRQIKSESILREKKIDELLGTLQKTEEELNRRTKEAENVEALKKMYNEDKTYWENKLTETEAFLKDSSQHCELLNKQLENGQETINHLQKELSQLNDRLVRGAEENEVLYLKIRELEGRSSSTLSMARNRGRSVESLSDLANIDLDRELESMDKDRIIEEYDELRSRFEKAIHEIRAMKRELRESHNLYDELELANLTLKRDLKLREECNQSQISMMADRIQDLTSKLSISDKQVRALKHKLQKLDSRDKRRSLSLKGKDSFSLGKEVEEKLTELENKISQLEGGNIVTTTAPVIQPPSPVKEKSPSSGNEQDSKTLKRLSARLRRKSLDSATSSEPMKMLIRLSSLETKVGNAISNKPYLAASCESLVHNGSDTHTPESSESNSTSSSHRHLLDRLQSLENVVISSRNKVNECICQVSAIRASKSRRSPSPILEKTYSMKSIERSLTDVSRTLQDCADKCILPFDSICEGEDINDSVMSIVSKLESQLRTKLLDISKKKCALLESGELNQRRSLEFLAEKLAYEAVLISRINDAVTNIHGDSLLRRLNKSEAEETSQLVTSLQSKLNGTIIKCQTSCKNSMDYLAKILSRKISSLNPIALDKLNQSQNIIQTKEIEMLKALQKEMSVAVDRYKSEKMIELTKALIIEALNCHPEDSLDYDQQRTNIENVLIQDAWCSAQDIVNGELINSEISHVMKRCTQYYASQLDSDKRSRFTLVASQQVALEKWFQAAHQQLSKEMNKAFTDITSHYQECLTSVRLRSPLNEDQPAVDSRQLLFQLADVIAHKALIDAKIYVCSGGFDADFELNNDMYSGLSKSTSDEKIWNRMTESDNVIASLDIDPTQEAEFIYLFQHFSNECRALFSDEFSEHKNDLLKISEALSQVEMVVKRLHLQIDDGKGYKDSSSKGSENRTQLEGVLDLCDSLKKSVEALSVHIPCQDCLRLQSALSRLRSEHEETLTTLKAEQERNIENKRSLELVRGRARTAEELVSSLQQQHKSAQRRAQRNETEAKQLKQQIADHQSECQHLQAQHEQEQLQLKEQARRLQKRLGTLDSEYSQQLEQLRSAYNKSLSADLQGDSIRQRYQAEIEQLRVLCEKGLMAMENSHRRIIQEMEEKHRTEREQLRVDKEQALAEETQATLAALDAMRKAHENEVQREVSKFKRDYTSRSQNSGDVTQMHMRHQQEMEEIKQEILSLSEKYSSKCVESADLEEKLCNVTQQLTQAQQHILQLDARNKQLRAHLVSEINELNNADTTSLTSIREDASPGTDGVHITSTPLWDHLRHLAKVWQNDIIAEGSKGQSVDTGTRQVCGAQNKDTVCKDGKHTESKAITSAELKGFPRVVSRCSKPSRRASISPLLGIVAERKKRFEL